jgi:predicted nucleic acid-binding Zn ribbon protein
MPTYVYETVPRTPNEPIDRFEMKQGFDEAPLAQHPETGQPVRRIITGGLGVVATAKGTALPEPGPGCGPDTCQCGRFN